MSYHFSMNGIGAKSFTAKKGGDVTDGQPVYFVKNSTVADAPCTYDFCGVCIGSRGDLVTVQYRGFVTLSFSGAAPQLGYNPLVADGNGGVMIEPAASCKYLVSQVDKTAKTCCILL